MAVSRAQTTQTDVYRAHANEARAAHRAAIDDGVAAALDHAASSHDTAARLLEHADRCDGRASRAREAAAQAQSKRQALLAQEHESAAQLYAEAAEAARKRAAHWHAKGHRHFAEAKTMTAVKPEDASQEGTRGRARRTEAAEREMPVDQGAE